MKKSIKIGLGAFFLVLVAGAAIYFGNPQLLRGAVIAMPSFNLRVREVEAGPAKQIYVKNTGVLPIPPFRYLFSQEGEHHREEYLNMLAPGQEIKLHERRGESYYFFFVVDPRNNLTESNEVDNFFLGGALKEALK